MNKGCDFCNKKEELYGFFIDENVLYFKYDKNNVRGFVIKLCPLCGRNLEEELEESEVKN